MTSKEALELLELILLNHSSMLVINDKRFEYFNVIKDRLEALEQENQDLKELQELNKQGLWNLKQENKILKMSVKDTYETGQEIIYDLTQENEKLKKVIEILKDKLKLSLNDNKAIKTINAVLPIGNNDMNRLTQQEYELLKKVLASN